jgi:hypothetical protein
VHPELQREATESVKYRQPLPSTGGDRKTWMPLATLPLSPAASCPLSKVMPHETLGRRESDEISVRSLSLRYQELYLSTSLDRGRVCVSPPAHASFGFQPGESSKSRALANCIISQDADNISDIVQTHGISTYENGA